MKTEEITELTELTASKVSGVASPANGTPFLVMKAKDDVEPEDKPAEIEDEPTEPDDDTPSDDTEDESGDDESPSDDGETGDDAEKSDSAEADAIASELTDETAKSAVGPGVVDGALDEPTMTGKIPSGTSGVAGAVADIVAPLADAAHSLGGKSSYEIPAEGKIDDNPPRLTVDPPLAKGFAVACLSEFMDRLGEQRIARKEGGFLDEPGPDATASPGDMPWESYDSATLQQVTTCLAACCQALDVMQQREAIEAVTGDAADIGDAWDLEDAACALEYAMGIVARLSFQEAAEANGTEATGVAEKAYRRLNVKDASALRTARDHLSGVLDANDQHKAGQASSDDEGDTIQMEVTKQELAETIAASAIEAVKQAMKAERKAKKNANNDGDVTEAEVKAEGSVSDDLEGVEGGGKVDAQYVGKSETETADQLAAVTKQLEALTETVTKIAKRPRSGGPILDGQARGAFPANGRQSDEVAKSDEIEQLAKALDAATDPQARAELGNQLTYARLLQKFQGQA